ncbi:MAG: DNA alkylation repair protein [Clostridia bacterium]|nr:DNA alkylation repair protein [Clostridia bacterium]
MVDINNRIRDELFAKAEEKYKAFQCSLMPTVDKSAVLGVRTPTVRKMAKKYGKDENIKKFLLYLPHGYYEENNLHAFIIERITDFEECLQETERFLPYIDNWATCDGMRPKCFYKNKNRLLPYLYDWINSEHTYTVRYGIGMLMVHFLNEDFLPEYLKTVAEIKSDEYYVNMMRAWYFATALAKQYEDTLPYIENRTLDDFTHAKAIQKAVESYRISDDKKTILKGLR